MPEEGPGANGGGGSTHARKVVLVGAYGIENAGDDAPAVVLTDGLRRRWPEVDFSFTIVGRRPDPSLCDQCGAAFLPTPEHATREEAAGRWFRGLNPGDDRADLRALESAIAGADLVVAGAGNLLVDLTIDYLRGPVPLAALYLFLADLHRTPFLLYGLSAGPLRTPYGRDLAGWIARRASAVTCRDEPSARLLHEIAGDLPIEVWPDPALALRPPETEAVDALFEAERVPREPARERLAVAVRDLGFLGGEHRPLVVETLRRLAARFELLFLPQCTGLEADDREEARRVARELGRAELHLVEGRHAPSALLGAYGTARATLALRLHGAVFGALAGAPPAALSYLPKVRSFLESVGLGRFAIDIDAATPGALVAAVEEAAALDGDALARTCRERGRGADGYVLTAGRLMGLL